MSLLCRVGVYSEVPQLEKALGEWEQAKEVISATTQGVGRALQESADSVDLTTAIGTLSVEIDKLYKIRREVGDLLRRESSACRKWRWAVITGAELLSAGCGVGALIGDYVIGCNGKSVYLVFEISAFAGVLVFSKVNDFFSAREIGKVKVRTKAKEMVLASKLIENTNATIRVYASANKSGKVKPKHENLVRQASRFFGIDLEEAQGERTSFTSANFGLEMV